MRCSKITNLHLVGAIRCQCHKSNNGAVVSWYKEVTVCVGCSGESQDFVDNFLE
jgi:hypothetical protein